jgi:hypothetical protein
MKTIAITAVMAAFLAAPATALALMFVMEGFGNAPVVKQPGGAEGVLGVVNLPSRVYWIRRLGNFGFGDENFFYQGDARAVNEALRKFAAVKADMRQLILLPGRGKAQSLRGIPVPSDWQLQVRSGPYKQAARSMYAVLTVYVGAEVPRGPVDRQQAKKWISRLDDDSFATRQAASRELGKLGRAAKPLLREALKSRPSPEVYRRIEALLAKWKGFDAGDLEIPKGLAFVTASDFVEAHLKGLSGTDLTKCNIAWSGLVELAPSSAQVVPALTSLLKKGKSESVRRLAASCLGRIGAGAKAALPALKTGLDDPGPNIRTAFRAAIDQIEKAKPEPGWGDEIKKRRAILKDLDELKKARKKGRDEPDERSK